LKTDFYFKLMPMIFYDLSLNLDIWAGRDWVELIKRRPTASFVCLENGVF